VRHHEIELGQRGARLATRGRASGFDGRDVKPRGSRSVAPHHPPQGDRHDHPDGHPAGPRLLSGAPNLPAGFTDTFTSRFVDTGEVRLHAVIGGDGPPLLLIHGWPGSWYYWRLVMPALARDFEVIVVDQRGIGLSDKPEEGYDTASLANDLVGLMVAGREHIFFGAEFSASAGTKKLRDDAIQYYVDGLSDPAALHGSFQLYRAFGATAAQNAERKARRLPMPVLAMGGAESSGAMAADTMKLAADDVQALVIPGVGHWLAEQAPDELVSALTGFLAPYRDAA
jgi:pimeloyl-ACP methyl ester carboxylesterase